jgi:DNA-binding NarL/FixJ family response regulator
LSEATVKVHRRNLMQKLNVTSISQLILQFGIFSNENRLAA